MSNRYQILGSTYHYLIHSSFAGSRDLLTPSIRRDGYHRDVTSYIFHCLQLSDPTDTSEAITNRLEPHLYQ